jgi:hypothetical protein
MHGRPRRPANGRSASRNAKKRVMQDHVKAARARTTFVSADCNERRPRDNPTTAYSPDLSKYAARMFATDFTPSSRNREPGHTFGTVELQTLIDNIFETMRSGRGIGLATPQIGVSSSNSPWAVMLGCAARSGNGRCASRCYPRRRTPSLDLSNRRSISSRSSSSVGEISAKLPKIRRLISELSLQLLHSISLQVC